MKSLIKSIFEDKAIAEIFQSKQRVLVLFSANNKIAPEVVHQRKAPETI
jgi:hypothetical protein